MLRLVLQTAPHVSAPTSTAAGSAYDQATKLGIPEHDMACKAAITMQCGPFCQTWYDHVLENMQACAVSTQCFLAVWQAY